MMMTLIALTSSLVGQFLSDKYDEHDDNALKIFLCKQGVETSMEEAAEKVKEAKEAVFEDLENQTGTTPSSTGDHCPIIEGGDKYEKEEGED